MMQDDIGRYRRDFFNRHGGRAAAESDGQWVVFPSGARMEATSIGAYWEPPKDAYERTRWQRTYWSLRHDRLKAEYDELTAEVKRMASANVTLGLEGRVRRAKALKREVRDARRELERAERRLDKLDPHQSRKPWWDRNTRSEVRERDRASARAAELLAELD